MKFCEEAFSLPSPFFSMGAKVWASRRLLRRAALASVPRGLFCPIVDAHIGPAVGAVVDVPIAFAVVDDGGIGKDHLAAAVVADSGDFHRDDLLCYPKNQSIQNNL